MQFQVLVDFGYGEVAWCGMKFTSHAHAEQIAGRSLKGFSWRVAPANAAG